MPREFNASHGDTGSTVQVGLPASEVAADRPEFCTDAMLSYLDDLRESGVTNMLGAGSYLESEFPELTYNQRTHPHHSCPNARAVLSYWMKAKGAK